jgi:hypothetical protein
MRLLVTKGPHAGQELDFGSAQGAAALREGWARLPEEPATPSLVEFGDGQLTELHGLDQVIPVSGSPSLTAADLAAAMPAAALEVAEIGDRLKDAVQGAGKGRKRG